MMNSISKYAIGILLGVALIICYIFSYHKPALKLEYDRGVKDGIHSVGVMPADTIKWVDTVYAKSKPVKPKLDSLTKTFSIDTTVWDDYGNVHIYSDDIINGLNVKPTYYEFYQLVLDTIIITEMDTVYVPDKPVINFSNFTTGAIVGGTVVGVITYFITKAVIKKE